MSAANRRRVALTSSVLILVIGVNAIPVAAEADPTFAPLVLPTHFYAVDASPYCEGASCRADFFVDGTQTSFSDTTSSSAAWVDDTATCNASGSTTLDVALVPSPQGLQSVTFDGHAEGTAVASEWPQNACESGGGLGGSMQFSYADAPVTISITGSTAINGGADSASGGTDAQARVVFCYYGGATEGCVVDQHADDDAGGPGGAFQGSIELSEAKPYAYVEISTSADTEALANGSFQASSDAQLTLTVASSASGFSISDATQPEGDSGSPTMNFTVGLPGPATSPVSVDYETFAVSADAGTDFTPTSGTVSLASGETSEMVTVGIKADRLREPHETFYVLLSNPVATAIDDGTGVGTISNDDLCDNIFNSNANTIVGTSGNDVLCGGGGADTISGGGGGDIIYGGPGDDVLAGNDGGDTILGQLGHDTVNGGDGDDFVHGNDGSDDLSGQAGEDRLYGHDDRDIVDGGVGEDRLFGGDGTDVISGGADKDFVYGGGSGDKIFGEAGADRLHGDGGGDTVHGQDGPDIIWGGTGEDTLHGEDSTDTINGEDNRDTIRGGAARDIISGNAGPDLIHGGSGDDEISGGPHDDVLWADSGSDGIEGNAGEDMIRGGQDDTKLDGLDGGPDQDFIFGGPGPDYLWGRDGADVMDGRGGGDALFGNEGPDSLEDCDGSAGDELNGGEGHDHATLTNSTIRISIEEISAC